MNERTARSQRGIPTPDQRSRAVVEVLKQIGRPAEKGEIVPIASDALEIPDAVRALPASRKGDTDVDHAFRETLNQLIKHGYVSHVPKAGKKKIGVYTLLPLGDAYFHSTQHLASNGKRKRAIDPDVEHKIAIERAARDLAIETFKARGYDVDNVEKSNYGWDLTAKKDVETICIEVKGTAHGMFTPELTPNEYDNLLKRRLSYCLFIVTRALDDPTPHEFRYSDDRETWVERDGERILMVEPRAGARLRFNASPRTKRSHSRPSTAAAQHQRLRVLQQ